MGATAGRAGAGEDFFMAPRIVVLGSGFAGLTVAAELRQRLGSDPTITLISKEEEFVFLPSLIWVPFGLRKREDITFNVRPVLQQNDVVFVQAAVTRIDLEQHEVHTPAGVEPFDYLVIATGVKPDYASIPGLGPQAHSRSIYSWADAVNAQVAFERFLAEPGPIVIGAAQGASFIQPAYEFALNMAHHLRVRGPLGWQRMTFVTPEPYIGHLGLGSVGSSIEAIKKLFDEYQIDVVTDASIQEVQENALVLDGGQALHFKFAMIAPPFVGIDPVRACTSIVDAKGFVRVKPTYEVEGAPGVYAAGACVSIPPVEKTTVPLGFPTSGYVTEEMARVVAHNIAAELAGQKPLELLPSSMAAKWILDAGNTGIFMSVDHQAGAREHTRIMPGPHAHWAKVAFEKYFLATRRMGLLS
jgi:sulfide:quinone oxidoreductase